MRNPKQSSTVMLFLAAILVLTLLLFAPLTGVQGGNGEPAFATTVCSFADAKEVSVRYVPSTAKEVPRLGKLWSPGGYPILLFAETELRVGNADIPSGAYSIYLIPDNAEWTLILNRNVTSGGYDGRQDLLRARMQTGELPQRSGQFTIYFGRVGPRECDLRLDYGKTRAWIDFDEK